MHTFSVGVNWKAASCWKFSPWCYNVFFSLSFSPCRSLIAIQKKNLNRSPLSIRPDHDGFKRGSITSACLKTHLHCLPHICHVWFSWLVAVYRSIVITVVKLKTTKVTAGLIKHIFRINRPTWSLMTSAELGCLSCAFSMWDRLNLQRRGSHSDIIIRVQIMCVCLAKQMLFLLSPCFMVAFHHTITLLRWLHSSSYSTVSLSLLIQHMAAETDNCVRGLFSET